MNKILLVGNGLTSSLIPDYQNERMMSKIKEQALEIFEKADTLFACFRKKVNKVQYTSIAWEDRRDSFDAEEKLVGPIIDILYNGELWSHIKNQFREQGLSETKLNLYFKIYGLIYETQNDEISNVESLLKIINLFSEIGYFSSKDEEKIRILANHIYFNEGNCGNQSLAETIKTGLYNWLSEYDKIFTTNYDSLLDDTLSTDTIRHLHGGFYYEDKYKRSVSIVPPDKAYIIWGISGEEKAEKMKGGFTITMTFPFESPMSLFEIYLSELKSTQAEQVDIFGYSGENDQHINEAISQNTAIKEVHYFCNPDKVADIDEEFSIKHRFKLGNDKKLVLESWNVVWNRLK